MTILAPGASTNAIRTATRNLPKNARFKLSYSFCGRFGFLAQGGLLHLSSVICLLLCWSSLEGCSEYNILPVDFSAP